MNTTLTSKKNTGAGSGPSNGGQPDWLSEAEEKLGKSTYAYEREKSAELPPTAPVIVQCRMENRLKQALVEEAIRQGVSLNVLMARYAIAGLKAASE
jgi:hypothetical protein